MIEIRNTTRGPLPRIAFEKIARELLGARYELSLVICGDSLGRRMNKKYRNKSYSPNVLSFPLLKREGEIFLNPEIAAREAKRFGVSLRARLVLLFAHGCLHLKGLRHGAKMDKLEQRAVNRFG